MKQPRFSWALALSLGVFATGGWTFAFAQAPTPRSRPAARSKAAPAAPTATPATPAAIPAASPTSASTPPLLNPEAKPADTPPPPADATNKETTETDIDATQSASFNSKDRIAVFTGNVRVRDPRFELACDELTVYLAKGAAPGADDKSGKGTPAPVNPPANSGAQPSPTPGGGGIDHAVASGHVIIVQRKAATKPGEEDKLSIGRGGLGTFDNKTGDMVLKDWPSLEQNGSSLIATAQSTVMTIHRDSSMNTDGPSKTKLVQHGKGAAADLIPTGPAMPTGNGKPKPASPAAPGPGSRRPQPTPASN